MERKKNIIQVSESKMSDQPKINYQRRLLPFLPWR